MHSRQVDQLYAERERHLAAVIAAFRRDDMAAAEIAFDRATGCTQRLRKLRAEKVAA